MTRCGHRVAATTEKVQQFPPHIWLEGLRDIHSLIALYGASKPVEAPLSPGQTTANVVQLGAHLGHGHIAILWGTHHPGY